MTSQYGRSGVIRARRGRSKMTDEERKLIKDFQDELSRYQLVTNQLMRESFEDVAKMAENHHFHIPVSDIAHLAGKVFDARWQGFMQDLEGAS